MNLQRWMALLGLLALPALGMGPPVSDHEAVAWLTAPFQDADGCHSGMDGFVARALESSTELGFHVSPLGDGCDFVYLSRTEAKLIAGGMMQRAYTLANTKRGDLGKLYSEILVNHAKSLRDALPPRTKTAAVLHLAIKPNIRTGDVGPYGKFCQLDSEMGRLVPPANRISALLSVMKYDASPAPAQVDGQSPGDNYILPLFRFIKALAACNPKSPLNFIHGEETFVAAVDACGVDTWQQFIDVLQPSVPVAELEKGWFNTIPPGHVHAACRPPKRKRPASAPMTKPEEDQEDPNDRHKRGRPATAPVGGRSTKRQPPPVDRVQANPDVRDSSVALLGTPALDVVVAPVVHQPGMRLVDLAPSAAGVKVASDHLPSPLDIPTIVRNPVDQGVLQPLVGDAMPLVGPKKPSVTSDHGPSETKVNVVPVRDPDHLPSEVDIPANVHTPVDQRVVTPKKPSVESKHPVDGVANPDKKTPNKAGVPDTPEDLPGKPSKEQEEIARLKAVVDKTWKLLDKMQAQGISAMYLLADVLLLSAHADVVAQTLSQLARLRETRIIVEDQIKLTLDRIDIVVLSAS